MKVVRIVGRVGDSGEGIGGKDMANLKNTGSKRTLPSITVMLLCATTAAAQTATDRCRPAPVIPLAREPRFPKKPRPEGIATMERKL
jgi:hypothetical protein